MNFFLILCLIKIIVFKMEAFTAGAITMYTIGKIYNWYTTDSNKQVHNIKHPPPVPKIPYKEKTYNNLKPVNTNTKCTNTSTGTDFITELQNGRSKLKPISTSVNKSNDQKNKLLTPLDEVHVAITNKFKNVNI